MQHLKKMKNNIKIISIILICFSSCKNSNDKNIVTKQEEVITNKKTTILLNSERNKWLEKSYGYEQWNPTEEDLKIIQVVLNDAIKNGEFDFLKKPVKQYISKYYKQYIPYINTSGERIIEINAFCEILKIPPIPKSKNQEWTEMNWKKRYVMVDDGGSCYWKIQINIDKKEYYDFMVNGNA